MARPLIKVAATTRPQVVNEAMRFSSAILLTKLSPHPALADRDQLSTAGFFSPHPHILLVIGLRILIPVNSRRAGVNCPGIIIALSAAGRDRQDGQ